MHKSKTKLQHCDNYRCWNGAHKHLYGPKFPQSKWETPWRRVNIYMAKILWDFSTVDKLQKGAVVIEKATSRRKESRVIQEAEMEAVESQGLSGPSGHQNVKDCDHQARRVAPADPRDGHKDLCPEDSSPLTSRGPQGWQQWANSHEGLGNWLTPDALLPSLKPAAQETAALTTNLLRETFNSTKYKVINLLLDKNDVLKQK